MKITKLTQAQIDKFPEYVKKWTDIGLSTAPADRPKAEKAIKQMYILGGLNPPQQIIWCGSPLSQALTRAMLQEVYKATGNNVKTSIDNNIKESVWNNIKNSVSSSVWYSIEHGVGNSIQNNLKNIIWNSIWNSVMNSVRDNVKNSVVDNVKYNVWNSIYGFHNASWLGDYDYLRTECNLDKETEKSKALQDLAQSAGWALPCENICFVSERPCILNRDNENRIHSLTEPAIGYPDGWNIYAVHGIQVPEYIIKEPNKITPKLIDQENNIEVRRIMLQIYGVEKYLQEGKYEVLCTDKDQFNRIRRLLKKDNGLDEAIVRVEVVNSSPELDNTYKKYYLPVDPELRPILKDPEELTLDLSRIELISEGYLGKPQEMTCHNAVASTFGKYGYEYGLEGCIRQGDVYIEFKDGSNKLKFRES